MTDFADRLDAVYVICAKQKTNLHLSVNGLYGRFEAYFDPGKQGLDPIPDYTNNSLVGLLEQIEQRLGIPTPQQAI
ncbi:hypothetical protein D3C81_190670 [compost metagenome]